MGTRYLIDTNTVIYYLDNVLPKSTSDFLDKLFDSEANISVITHIELLSWFGLTSESVAVIESFIENTNIFQLSAEIVEKTIEIRRLKKFKLGDGIIAATALIHGCKIITRNISDFKNIDGLECIDPYKDI